MRPSASPFVDLSDAVQPHTQGRRSEHNITTNADIQSNTCYCLALVASRCSHGVEFCRRAPGTFAVFQRHADAANNGQYQHDTNTVLQRLLTGRCPAQRHWEI